MPRGGYQQPEKPAVQSGPGALSQRTDGGPASKQAARYVAGGDYGDGGLMGIQQGAPMSATPAPRPMPVQSGQPDQRQSSQVIPLNAPTQRPDEPVTAGAASGAGPGPEVLRLAPHEQMGGQSAKQVIQGLAAHPDAAPELKTLNTILGG